MDSKEKLKTLKDIDMASDDGLVSKDNLREEAIKWHRLESIHARRFIEDFFNITEEDLK